MYFSVLRLQDASKKLDQTLSDHQKYSKAYNEASTWLSERAIRLSEIGVPAADREEVQSQMDALQEFMVHQEQGQSLLHAAHTYGEKAMAGTASQGRDVIRQELAALQAQWDDFRSATSDTRSDLESQLLRWADFDDSSSTVGKWLEDMQAKVKDAGPKMDLSEKKVKLQKVKVRQSLNILHRIICISNYMYVPNETKIKCLQMYFDVA